MKSRTDIRNIAIIAHVDHGKTTLVDELLTQTGTVDGRHRIAERAMDKLDLERERGITILSKNTAIRWRDTTINIVDTPGHSDFGGEVERVLGMVDSVLLLVDAFEGPMPQTRFVLRKALGHSLRPIVVINKVDRPDGRPEEVLNEIFDLFCALEADDAQLDFPVLYASGREGWAIRELGDPRQDVTPLLSAILAWVPPPDVDRGGPFQMQVATIDYNEFVGRIAVGRITRGGVRRGGQLCAIAHDGTERSGKVSKLIGYWGLSELDLGEASAGDIIGIAGIQDAVPGETLTDPSHRDQLPPIAVDEPTVSMEFIANNSPVAGTEGRYVTSRQLRTRLMREKESNVSLRVADTDKPEVLMVCGRGELHLGILIETMRREGYELMVSMPRVILREGPDGREEPYEDLAVDCHVDFQGTVINELNQRGGTLEEMRRSGVDGVRLLYRIPSQGLIGYRSQFLTQTRGTGSLYSTFGGYGPYKGELRRRARGVLVVLESGKVTAKALETLQDRGTMFVEPGVTVYGGQLCGENARNNDMVVNPCKAPKMDNMRTAFKEIDIRLNTPRKLGLEEALEFINADELVEVTPAAIRLRKRILGHSERRREEKQRG